jgi:hypothetical protein
VKIRRFQLCVPAAYTVFAAMTACTVHSTTSTDGGASAPAEGGTPLGSLDSGSAGDAGAASETGLFVDAAGMAQETSTHQTSEGGISVLGYKASNVGPADFGQAGDVSLTASSCVIDTDALKIDCVQALSDGGHPYAFTMAQQADGSPLAVLVVQSLTIGASAQVLARGSNPLAIVAQSTVNIQGSLVAQGGGVGADGPNAGGARQTASGTGGGAGGGGAPIDGSGGGGGYCGIGGTGGTRTDGGTPAPSGKAYGSASNVPLLGGASGGGPVDFPAGGPGGGAIQISAGASVLVGTNGVISVPGYGAVDSFGGGGSGGAILLEAPMVTINGALAANGGSGDAGGGRPHGQNGTATIQPAVDSAHWGGNGSADTTIDGAPGTVDPGGNYYNVGGGGGGAGRIRINTTSGAATLGPSAVVSPATSTKCTTQGMLGQ